MSNKTSKEDVYKNLEIVNSWINNIDLKASFILAFLGIILGNILNSNNIKILRNAIAVPLNSIGIYEILKIIIVLLLIITSLISGILLIFTLLARIKLDNRSKSYFFFGDISMMDRKEFVNKFSRKNDNNLKKDILNQVYANSKICEYKSKLYNKSVYFVIITLILFFINYIIN